MRRSIEVWGSKQDDPLNESMKSQNIVQPIIPYERVVSGLLSPNESEKPGSDNNLHQTIVIISTNDYTCESSMRFLKRKPNEQSPSPSASGLPSAQDFNDLEQHANVLLDPAQFGSCQVPTPPTARPQGSNQGFHRGRRLLSCPNVSSPSSADHAERRSTIQRAATPDACESSCDQQPALTALLQAEHPPGIRPYTKPLSPSAADRPTSAFNAPPRGRAADAPRRRSGSQSPLRAQRIRVHDEKGGTPFWQDWPSALSPPPSPPDGKAQERRGGCDSYRAAAAAASAAAGPGGLCCAMVRQSVARAVAYAASESDRADWPVDSDAGAGASAPAARAPAAGAVAAAIVARAAAAATAAAGSPSGLSRSVSSPSVWRIPLAVVLPELEEDSEGSDDSDSEYCAGGGGVQYSLPFASSCRPRLRLSSSDLQLGAVSPRRAAAIRAPLASGQIRVGPGLCCCGSPAKGLTPKPPASRPVFFGPG
jgi:hypothetical protein